MLQVEYDARYRSGEQQHYIAVFLRSVEEGNRVEQIRIPVRGWVQAYVTSNTRSIDFGSAQLGQRYVRELALLYSDDCPLRGRPALLNGTSEFQLTSTDDPGSNRCCLKLTFVPRNTSGHRHRTLRVDTGITGYPAAKIEVSAEVTGAFILEPQAVHWGSSTNSGSRIVNITSREPPGSRVVRIDGVPDFVDAKLEDSETGQRLTLNLKRNHLVPGEVFLGTIRLQTNRTDEPFVEIEVDGLSPPGQSVRTKS